MATPTFTIKRIYEPCSDEDGYRVLVDRLWPRGIKKEAAHLDEWAKEIAPSTALRKRYNHQPERWEEFKRSYTKELENNKNVSEYLKKWIDKRQITLLYASKSAAFSHALLLRQYLVDAYQTMN